MKRTTEVEIPDIGKNPTRCPVCGGEGEYLGADGGGELLVDTLRCWECGAIWANHYKYERTVLEVCR